MTNELKYYFIRGVHGTRTETQFRTDVALNSNHILESLELKAALADHRVHKTYLHDTENVPTSLTLAINLNHATTAGYSPLQAYSRLTDENGHNVFPFFQNMPPYPSHYSLLTQLFSELEWPQIKGEQAPHQLPHTLGEPTTLTILDYETALQISNQKHIQTIFILEHLDFSDEPNALTLGAGLQTIRDQYNSPLIAIYHGNLSEASIPGSPIRQITHLPTSHPDMRVDVVTTEHHWILEHPFTDSTESSDKLILSDQLQMIPLDSLSPEVTTSDIVARLSFIENLCFGRHSSNLTPEQLQEIQSSRKKLQAYQQGGIPRPIASALGQLWSKDDIQQLLAQDQSKFTTYLFTNPNIQGLESIVGYFVIATPDGISDPHIHTLTYNNPKAYPPEIIDHSWELLNFVLLPESRGRMGPDGYNQIFDFVCPPKTSYLISSTVDTLGNSRLPLVLMAANPEIKSYRTDAHCVWAIYIP